MSSFIVEKKTINRIVTFLDWHGSEYRNDILGSQLNRVLKEHNIILKKEKDCEKLANSLLLLNKLAVAERYNETNILTLMKFKDTKSNIYQVLKSLHCLIYQCSEGEVPEQPLFKMLDEIIEIIESNIIHELPEYNKASWG